MLESGRISQVNNDEPAWSIGMDLGRGNDTTVVSILAPDGLRPRVVSQGVVNSGTRPPTEPKNGDIFYNTRELRLYIFDDGWTPLTGPEKPSVITSRRFDPPGSRKLDL